MSGPHFSEKYLSVIEICKNILEINPKALFAMNNIGQSYARLKNAEQSLVWYLYNKARAMTDIERYEDTIKIIDRLQELGDNDPQIFVEKGVALVELQRFEEALVGLYFQALIQAYLYTTGPSMCPILIISWRFCSPRAGPFGPLPVLPAAHSINPCLWLRTGAYRGFNDYLRICVLTTVDYCGGTVE